MLPVKHPKIQKMRTLITSYSYLQQKKKNIVVMQAATRWFHSGGI